MNNPQAFPNEHLVIGKTDKGHAFDRGMDLLTYVAVEAMKSLLEYKEGMYVTWFRSGSGSREELAVLSYDIAESMLKEREKRMK
jgi:hypothetical protein